MIVDWLQQAPVLLMALAIVFVPGLVAFSAVGLRGLALFAAAPLFGIASTALIAVGLGALGIGWSVISWLVATAVLVGLAFVIARLLRGWRAEASSGSPRWLLAVAVLAVGQGSATLLRQGESCYVTPDEGDVTVEADAAAGLVSTVFIATGA